MGKLKIGHLHGNAVQTFNAHLASNSQLEIEVGDGYDMSKRQITVLEDQQPHVLSELENLLKLVDELEAKRNRDPDVQRVCSEARTISKKAKKIVADQKWCTVSAAGLVKAAKTVGGMASPIAVSALKIIAILQKLHG